MKWTNDQLWLRFKKFYLAHPKIGLTLDVSRMSFGDDYLTTMAPRMQDAFNAMAELEAGAIANPDEERMVGHYWLRSPTMAPTDSIRHAITQTIDQIKTFASKIHTGAITGTHGRFESILLIGIGGSALGPQFVSTALSQPKTDKLRILFSDNTDPDGIDKVIHNIPNLGKNLCIIISKSGKTPETYNGMVEVKEAYTSANLDFAKHAVAITQHGSLLDKTAENEQWIARFPMWDWVGGRTSELSAVGLLPAAIQGFAIDELLRGARDCDEITRLKNVRRNPAALLALMWFFAGNGSGEKDMVILPYKDRLELFSRYLQQLIMESLGKESFINNQIKNQGIAVYGNKGSTDQHAYVQQLRDGLNNFFVTFVEVQRDRNITDKPSIKVKDDHTSGDYLLGFLLGTRQALFDKGRESVTITIKELNEYSLGVLIALYERTVGFYASLVHINAYHQPGVEAGKIAAQSLLDSKAKVCGFLKQNSGKAYSVNLIAQSIGESANQENIFKILEHLAVNPDRGVFKIDGDSPFTAKYAMK